MGRQVLLHMTAADQLEFLSYAEQKLKLNYGLRSGGSEAVARLDSTSMKEASTHVIWSELLSPDLKREWISEPGYYRVDTLRLAVLEFTPCFEAEWEGRPALCQGRLFGNFDPYLHKPKQFLRSYEILYSWLKKNYRRSSVAFNGYVGPSAWEFYRQGGYLLPFFVPPRTPEWLSSIASQHPS